jgi:undecaprenyl diphosphate synthase
MSSRIRRGLKRGSAWVHVAIVMDGNGRWASARGLDRLAGHRAGELALFDVLTTALDLKISHLTVFAFSTENWTRLPSEISGIFELIRMSTNRRRQMMISENINSGWLGNFSGCIPAAVIEALDETSRATSQNSALNFTICIDYGGRADMTDAARRICWDVLRGDLTPADVTEATYEKYLAGNMPKVNLLIRTSGEQRLSNFLLWQSADAKIVFCPKFWPDFKGKDLVRIMESYLT